MRILLTSIGKNEIRQGNIHSKSLGNLDLSSKKTIVKLKNKNEALNKKDNININVVNKSIYESSKNINQNILENFLTPKNNKNIHIRNNIFSLRYKKINIKKRILFMPSVIEMKYTKDILENKLKNFKLSLSNKKDNNNINFSEEKSYIKSPNEISLPYIKKVLPIKEIINNKNKNIMRKKFLEKIINEKETSLIKYLKLDKKITPFFVEKINKADIGKISRINKVCEYFFIHEKKNNIIQDKIKNKIEIRKIKRLETCKKNLRNMSYELKKYNSICNSLIDKKENIEEARKFFLKYYKK